MEVSIHAVKRMDNCSRYIMNTGGYFRQVLPAVLRTPPEAVIDASPNVSVCLIIFSKRSLPKHKNKYK